jgi:rare lipoprotein A
MVNALRRSRLKVCALLLAACQAGASKPPETSHPNGPLAGGAVPALRVSDSGANPADAESRGREHDSLARKYGKARAHKTLKGEASYYADSLAGRKTASGERYDPQAFTAAHRRLPFGTVLRVVRLDTGAEVYVRVNDRGPFARRRILDLSRAAAERLGMLRAGVVDVRVEVVKRAEGIE